MVQDIIISSSQNNVSTCGVLMEVSILLQLEELLHILLIGILDNQLKISVVYQQGNYIITVTDANLCTKATINITEPVSPIVTTFKQIQVVTQEMMEVSILVF